MSKRCKVFLANYTTQSFSNWTQRAVFMVGLKLITSGPYSVADCIGMARNEFQNFIEVCVRPYTIFCRQRS